MQKTLMQVWEVVGGQDHGGILVRSSCERSSDILPHRLQTGALVEELDLAGDRLHYKKMTGDGPYTGWVTVKISQKQLLVKQSVDDSLGVKHAAEHEAEDSKAPVRDNGAKPICSSASLTSNGQAESSAKQAASQSLQTPPGFTKDKSLEMVQELIDEFSKPEFQDRLHEAWAAAGGDPMQQGRARQKVCFPIQIPIVSKYGFEASKKGVLHSAMAHQKLLSHDLQTFSEHLKSLVNPDLQRLMRDEIDATMMDLESSPHARIWLDNLRLDTKPLYGDRIASSRVPLTILSTPRGQDSFLEYICQDPDGPWIAAASPGFSDSPKNLADWCYEMRDGNGTGDEVYTAMWHALQGTEFRRRVYVPREREYKELRRAPVRLLAFLEAMREVNASCWSVLILDLDKLKRKNPGNAQLAGLVDAICEEMKEGKLFGLVEANLCAGSARCKLRSSAKGTSSLLQMTLVLSGESQLRMHLFTENSAFFSREHDIWSERTCPNGLMKDFDMASGSASLFSSFHFGHGLRYASADHMSPVISLNCFFAFESSNARQLDDMGDESKLQVASLIASSVRQLAAQRKFRLPSLQEVITKQRAMQLEWLEFSSGATIVSAYNAKTHQHQSSAIDNASFVGSWTYNEGVFDIVDVNGELRWSESQRARQEDFEVGTTCHVCFDNNASRQIRGTLKRDTTGLGLVACANNGEVIKVACVGQDCLQISRKVSSAMRHPWSVPTMAVKRDPFEIQADEIISLETIQAVRKAAHAWSVDWKRPSADEAISLPLNYLASCNCGPADKRSLFLTMCSSYFKQLPAEPLMYVSFGSGDLWFDWWFLEALLAANYRLDSAHFIDCLYLPEVLAEAAGKVARPVKQMAAWFKAVGISCFAYESLEDFLRERPKGAHIVVQCDADYQGIDVSQAVRSEGFHFWLQGEGGSVAAWQRDQGEMKLLTMNNR